MNVLVVGSGPVVIGQAAEFDYSGAQAVRSLAAEGVRVVLLNSNPATVMTEPTLAHRTYLEPIVVETATWILEREEIDGLVAGLGGQAALNLATQLADQGVLERLGVKVLGTPIEAIKDAEDRGRFGALVERIGLKMAQGEIVTDVEAAVATAAAIGYPVVVRPAFTMGGEGGGRADDEAQLRRQAAEGLELSPVHQILVEEGLFGWKELEFEVVRDHAGDAAAICGMENVDPVGVHTGDSLVVAPILTVPDPVVQEVRRQALAVAAGIGIIGACNVQFALAPDGRIRVIEANPRASRSSALASKAVGYPIAQVAAKLALGRRLAELPNPATGASTACFEPAVDYVAVKMPCWPFNKVPSAPRTLGTRMKATGEVLAIDRTFPEAVAKAWSSAAVTAPRGVEGWDEATLIEKMRVPTDQRVLAVAEAGRRAMPMRQIQELTGFDPFFIKGLGDALDVDLGRYHGFKAVDGCAGEADATSPYFYSVRSHEEDEGVPFGRESVVILGSGPIRIGCGLEFDYGSVMATQGVRQLGYKAILVNNNPETVSTDFDSADRLYFEAITETAVLSILRKERPYGVMIQFGGQCALNMAFRLEEEGIRILGTSPDSIDRAEDRERFMGLLDLLHIPYPKGAAARTIEEGLQRADELGLPLMIRPSRVLGGRAMRVVHDPAELERTCHDALEASAGAGILLDRFIPGLEMEVDMVSDEDQDHLIAIMEHLEAAGVHSGDSIARFPTRRAPEKARRLAAEYSAAISRELKYVGLMNMQYVWDPGTEELFCLEANPRASRTVPFVSKATGVDLPGVAAQACLGETLAEQGYRPGLLLPLLGLVSYKVPAFSFGPMSGVDPVNGPEMLATGEAMGLGPDGETALRKALIGAGRHPRSPRLYVAVPPHHLDEALGELEAFLVDGFELVADPLTADALTARGRAVEVLGIPEACEQVREGRFGAVLNLAHHGELVERPDEMALRRAAVESRTSLYTRLDTAYVARVATRQGGLEPICLQDAHMDPSMRAVQESGVPA